LAGVPAAEEQVTTWGLDAFWGLPHYPRTPYYRTYKAPVGADAHLYEFVAPMVPPSWNDRQRVSLYAASLAAGATPTAVAVSILDVCAPAVDHGVDYHAHWALTHFLLDGHHKIHAAAEAARPLQLLSLLSLDASLAHRNKSRRSPPSARLPVPAVGTRIANGVPDARHPMTREPDSALAGDATER
jgi:hypothetical protein